MKRRSFLKKSTIFSLPAFLGGFNLSTMAAPMMRSLVNGDDKILILIDLSGGNDGLNTIFPLDSYDNLANARPNIIVPQGALLNINDSLAFHPDMKRAKQMYDNGNLSIVQGVGYADQNRSHFRSADIWNTGSTAAESKTTGWLGRYLDDTFPNYPADYPNADCPDPFAITLGRSISGACQGIEANYSLAIINTDDIGGLTTGVEAPLPNDCYGEELGYVVETFKKSNAYADQVINAADAGFSNEYLYSDSNLSNRLKTVAKFISGGLQTKIYVLTLGGFDTHANQVDGSDPATGKHAQLLKTLSEAIFAFQKDLEMQGLQDRVVGMTFSEFGRKIKSNAGNGTDHGSAAPMIIFGNCLNAGVIGNNAQIASNVNNNEGVAMQYDFKWVYGSILMDWFGVPEDKVKMLLTDDFQYLPIIGTCNEIPTSSHDLVSMVEATAFPNPFDQIFTLSFSILKKEKVRIQLFDVMGKTVRTISNKTFTEGQHDVLVETHSLSSGVYFARIEVGNGVKTMRVVKK